MEPEERYMAAITADALRVWDAAPKVDRYHWLTALASKKASPNQVMRRIGNTILKRRADEYRDLRLDAGSVMTFAEAIKVLDADGPDRRRYADAEYVVAVHLDRGEAEEAGTRRCTIDQIAEAVERDVFFDMSRKRQHQMIQVLRMNARSGSVKTARKCRGLLGVLDVPVAGPEKPKMKTTMNEATVRRIAQCREGLVQQALHKLYREMGKKGGNTVVLEMPATRFEAAMRMVEQGEAVVLRDEVRRPTRGRIPPGETLRRERRVVTIGLTGKVPAGNEDRI